MDNKSKRMNVPFNGNFDDFVLAFMKKADEVNNARREALLDVLRKSQTEPKPDSMETK